MHMRVIVICMANITLYLPKAVHEKWKDDTGGKSWVVEFIAQHYGLSINQSRVVNKPTASQS